jgi:hypothetical protein
MLRDKLGDSRRKWVTGKPQRPSQGHLERQATLYTPYPLLCLFSILKSISDPRDQGFHIFTFSLVFLLVLFPQLSFDNRINHSAVSPSSPSPSPRLLSMFIFSFVVRTAPFFCSLILCVHSDHRYMSQVQY